MRPLRGGIMIRRILVGLFCLIAVGGPFATSPRNEPILIKTTRLIDMSKGSVANDQAILINGVTVVEIGPSSIVSQHAAGNVRVVDLTGARFNRLPCPRAGKLKGSVRGCAATHLVGASHPMGRSQFANLAGSRIHDVAGR